MESLTALEARGKNFVVFITGSLEETIRVRGAVRGDRVFIVKLVPIAGQLLEMIPVSWTTFNPELYIVLFGIFIERL